MLTAYLRCFTICVTFIQGVHAGLTMSYKATLKKNSVSSRPPAACIFYFFPLFLEECRNNLSVDSYESLLDL